MSLLNHEGFKKEYIFFLMFTKCFLILTPYTKKLYID